MNDHSSSLTVEDLLAPAVCVPPPIHPHMPLYLRYRAQLHEWETLKDTYAASVIRNGLQLDWVDGFDPDRPTDDFRPRSSHAEVTDPELVKHVLDAVQQGCMERVERKDIKCCASMFAVDKASDEAHPEGGRRPITNLKNVNQFVQTTYFRLVTLWGILPFLRAGQYACKIDLKSAYFHMGIHPRDRPYLGVYVDGEFYRWCVLPFGLNVAPREWQRLMQPILNALRERGALVWVYLDDWLIIGNTYRECLEHTRFLVQLLHRLGILVNVPKSCLEPSQEIIMLGFMLNFREGFVAVPPKRLQAIFRDVNRLAHSHTPSVRRCASVLGRIRSLLFAMPHIRLLSDALAVHVAVAVQAGWEADVALPERVSRQLMDLADELHQWKGRTFVVSMGHVRDMYSDASDLAWGGVLQGNAQAAFGWFLNREEHINVKEFRGALLTIQAYALRDTTLRFFTDSMVLYWYLRKWGGRKPRFNALILQLWNFTQANRIEIQPFYVHTSVNPADIWSRLRWTPSEATFPSDVLTWILEEFKSWIQPEIDWMSRSSNAVCSKFVSPCPQPGAYAIDVFSQNLTLLSPGWVFPPFKLSQQHKARTKPNTGTPHSTGQNTKHTTTPQHDRQQHPQNGHNQGAPNHTAQAETGPRRDTTPTATHTSTPHSPGNTNQPKQRATGKKKKREDEKKGKSRKQTKKRSMASGKKKKGGGRKTKKRGGGPGGSTTGRQGRRQPGPETKEQQRQGGAQGEKKKRRGGAGRRTTRRQGPNHRGPEDIERRSQGGRNTEGRKKKPPTTTTSRATPARRGPKKQRAHEDRPEGKGEAHPNARGRPARLTPPRGARTRTHARNPGVASSNPKGAVLPSTRNSPGAPAQSSLERRAVRKTGRVSDRVHTRKPPQRMQPKTDAGGTRQGPPHPGAPNG